MNQRLLRTILHANWWVEPMCTIFYFHAPIWEFAHERSNCSCKAENAGVKPFLELESCLVLSSFECCWIFCDVIHIILFIKMHSQYMELLVSLANGSLTVSLNTCLHYSRERGPTGLHRWCVWEPCLWSHEWTSFEGRCGTKPAENGIYSVINSSFFHDWSIDILFFFKFW